jgi:hypothetical protein
MLSVDFGKRPRPVIDRPRCHCPIAVVARVQWCLHTVIVGSSAARRKGRCFVAFHTPVVLSRQAPEDQYLALLTRNDVAVCARRDPYIRDCNDSCSKMCT